MSGKALFFLYNKYLVIIFSVHIFSVKAIISLKSKVRHPFHITSVRFSEHIPGIISCSSERKIIDIPFWTIYAINFSVIYTEMHIHLGGQYLVLCHMSRH